MAGWGGGGSGDGRRATKSPEVSQALGATGSSSPAMAGAASALLLGLPVPWQSRQSHECETKHHVRAAALTCKLCLGEENVHATRG